MPQGKPWHNSQQHWAGQSDTAWGIYSVVTESMAATARIHIIGRNKDPRHYAMVAFGGAGPAHACEVARILGVKRVIAPSPLAYSPQWVPSPHPYPLRRYAHCPTCCSRWSGPASTPCTRTWKPGTRTTAGRPGCQRPRSSASDQRICGWWVRSTRSTCPFPLASDSPDRPHRDAFPCHLSGTLQSEESEHTYRDTKLAPAGQGAAAPGATPAGARDHGCGPAGGPEKHAAGLFPCEWRLSGLSGLRPLPAPPGCALHGPAIIEEQESTAVIGPRDRATIDHWLNLIVDVG